MSRNQWLALAVVGIAVVLGLVLCACLAGYSVSYLFSGRGGPPALATTAKPTEASPTSEETATLIHSPTRTHAATATSSGPTATPTICTPTHSHTPTDTPTHTPTDSPTHTPSKTPTVPISPCISCPQARDHIGEYTCVCCTIVRTYYCSSCSGQPTFLNSHDPYRGYFTAVVWGDNRQAFINHFGSPPESVFRNRFCCFCGLVEYYAPNDAPEITLRNPANACVDCTSCLR